MSEFNYVAFEAVNRSLDDQEMAFAAQQSSHAKITQRSFSFEQEYSSFRGDADGLLRHGFDVYFLTSHNVRREIKLRLPGGMPFPPSESARRETASPKRD